MPVATPPPSGSDSSASAAVSARAVVVWVWLIAYLAVFLRCPLFTTPEGPVSRFDYFWANLFRPDDLVRAWLSGFGSESLIERTWILSVTAAIACVALAAGWSCLRLLRVDRAVSRLEMTAFSLGVGLNLVSLTTLGLGLAGRLNRPLFIGIGLLVCAAAGAIYWRTGCASGTCALRETQEGGEVAGCLVVHRRWLWLAAPFVVAILLSAMLPPFDFDVREYHLQAPKEFYQAGRIAFLPHNVYANMPLGAEMPALTAMVVLDDWWTGALVGKTLLALFAPLTALALFAACLRFASPAAGIVAALAYISIPWVALVSSGGLVEGAFAFYLFAAFYGVLVWNDFHKTASSDPAGTSWGLLALTGFLAGAAVSTKYPALVYCLLPLAAYVVYQSIAPGDVPRPSMAGIALPAIVFLLAAAVGCGGWFVKNAALTGNPTYPLLYGVFDGATRTAEKDAQWRRAHLPPNFEPQDLARRGWNAVVASRWLSPLVVPLAVLAVVARFGRRLAWLVGGYLVFVFLTWWLLTHRIDRFLVPALPLAALLAGIGATWYSAPWWRRSLAALLTVGLAFDFLLVAGGPVADNRYLADFDGLRVDPARVSPWHLYFNDHADEVTGLLLVGDAEVFDLEMPVTYNTVFDDSIFEQWVRDRSPEELRRALYEHGISHVYVNWAEIARYRSPGNYGITEFIEPRVFDRLVDAGVLEPLPPLPHDSGQAYRVLAAETDR